MADDRDRETLWVLRAQVGDREALDALFLAVQEPLYRYLLGLLGEPATAEDVLQDVLLLIYRKLRWLREPEWFRAWCYRIAAREAFRRLKRDRRWPAQMPEPLDAIAAPPEPIAADLELLARLPDLLQRISPASRAVLALHYLNHLTLDEVSAILNIPVGTAKSRLAYGLSALRRQLAEPAEQPNS